MVVKADGTKWACMSCLKGHRVSGCTHTDRELILVPKKGRPVTQCHHCRAERKKRSAHVKCDCGEVDKPHHPKEKCIHLREAEDRLKAGFRDDASIEKDVNHLAAVAEQQGCCCHHGGKCTCSLLKREPRDSDDDGCHPQHGPAVKPRLDSRGSDGHITVFQNGHHKPVHRKNHAAHECGVPYKVPMPRTQSQQDIPSAARRSIEQFSMEQYRPRRPERQLSKSEQHSPGTGQTDVDQKMNGFDFNNLSQVSTNQSVHSVTSEAYSIPAFEPMSANGDQAYDPWSALPSGESIGMPNNNPFGVWPTNEGHSLAQPALTAASSGTQSEADEIPSLDDMYSFGMPSIQENPASFNPSTGPASESPQTNRRSLPPNFFSQSDLINLTNEWPSQMNLVADDKPKPADTAPSSAFNDPWQMSMSPTNGFQQRPIPGLTGRPASHSVGPGSAPTDDLMQQLFPGIDVSSNTFSSNSPVDTTITAAKIFNTEITSAPVDFALISQPWADGSMSVPNDPFNAPYDLDEDFSSTDFTSGWAS